MPRAAASLRILGAGKASVSQNLDTLLASRYGERLAHSSYLSSTYKYLYIDTPKAACTTLKHLVAGVENLSDADFAESLALDLKLAMLIHDRSCFRLPTLCNVPPETAGEALSSEKYFRFCFVRNPYSRLFSAWQSKILIREPYFLVNFKNMPAEFSRAELWDAIRQSFGRFVLYIKESEFPHFSDPHWRPQHELIFLDKIKYTLIGRTESFVQDIQPLLAHLKSHGAQADRLVLQNSNAGALRDWRWFYDAKTVALVQSIYSEDFRLLGYEPDFECSTRPLPLDAEGPGPGDWIEEVIARNEMIVSLRSRLVDKIAEVDRLQQALAAPRYEDGTPGMMPEPNSVAAQPKPPARTPRRILTRLAERLKAYLLQ